jgi:hypothetical protein
MRSINVPDRAFWRSLSESSVAEDVRYVTHGADSGDFIEHFHEENA